MRFTLVFIFVSFISNVIGFKVLGILPFVSKSHCAIGHGILNALHEAGHEITAVSMFPQKNQQPRYREIDLQDLFVKYEKGLLNIGGKIKFELYQLLF
jgi:hypothetical protein